MLKREHETDQKTKDGQAFDCDGKTLRIKKIKTNYKYDPKYKMWCERPKPPSEIATSNEPPPLQKKTDKMIMRRLETDVPLPQTPETKGYNLRQRKAKKHSDFLGSEQEQLDKALIVPKIKKRDTNRLFNKTIPILLLLDISKLDPYENDINKIDARINNKTSIEEEDKSMEIGDSLFGYHWISVPQTCFNEIMEKLQSQNGIVAINGKITSAGEDFCKTHSNNALKFINP